MSEGLPVFGKRDWGALVCRYQKLVDHRGGSRDTEGGSHRLAEANAGKGVTPLT